MPDIRAITVADALARHLIANFGVPRVILSDRGTSFKNRLFEELSKIFGFKLITTTSSHPQGNGFLERSHAILGSYIRTKAAEKQDLDKIIPFAMLEYNTSIHSSTGLSPFEIIHCRKARTLEKLPDEFELETYNSYLCNLIKILGDIRRAAREDLVQSKEKTKLQYDKKKKPKDLKVGMNVYVLREPRRGKLDEFFNGISKIKEIHSNNNVLLESSNGKTNLKHFDEMERAFC